MRKKIFVYILLLLIVGVFAGLILLLSKNIQTDAMSQAFSKAKTIPLLLSLEYGDKKHITSFLLLFEPKKKQIGVLEIPSYLGVYDKTLSQYIPIEYYYANRGYKAYYEKLSTEIGREGIKYLFMDTASLSQFVDMIGGVKLFIIIEYLNLIEESSSLSINEQAHIGSINLDGPDMARYYNKIELSNTMRLLKASQRKEIIISLLQKLRSESYIFKSFRIANRFLKITDTTLSAKNIQLVTQNLLKYDVSKILYQPLNGSVKEIDNKDKKKKVAIFFLGSEIGGLRRISQIFEKRLKENSIRKSNGENITLTILNGTVINGLASKTKELYEAAGLTVLSVGNAQEDSVQTTVIIDRIGNKVNANIVAEVIGAKNIITDITTVDSAGANFTLILGEDFNGEQVNNY